MADGEVGEAMERRSEDAVDRVARIRHEIAAGAYWTAQKEDIAFELMVAKELDGRAVAQVLNEMQSATTEVFSTRMR